MNIAVTGANGHIGCNLCRHLIEHGHQVRALVHRNNQGIKGLSMGFVPGDLMDPGSLYPFLEDIEVVFHLAAVISIKARDKDEIFRQNVGGTENIIEASRKEGIRRFIHFSSIHALVNKPLDQVMDERRPLATQDKIIYSRTKALAEEVVLESVKGGLDAVILSPTAVIGPYDYAPSLLGRALIQMYLGKLPALVNGGYDWVDVRDVVKAAVVAIEKGSAGERYILSGHWRNLRDLSRLVSASSRRKPPLISVPIVLAQVALPFLKLYCRLIGTEPLYTQDSLTILRTGHKNISHEKASREFGFSPRPLEETIEDALVWYRENGLINR